MSRLSTSAGDCPEPSVSMRTLCRTRSGFSSVPRRTTPTNSDSTRSAIAMSAGSPVSVTALPRTWMSAARCDSSSLRFLSPAPSSPKMTSGDTSIVEVTAPGALFPAALLCARVALLSSLTKGVSPALPLGLRFGSRCFDSTSIKRRDFTSIFRPLSRPSGSTAKTLISQHPDGLSMAPAARIDEHVVALAGHLDQLGRLAGRARRDARSRG